MAGGTFTTQNKTRAGAYVNVVGNGKTGTAESTIGIVALPLELSFGAEKEVIEVTATTDLTQFGESLNSTHLLPLREALKKARKVLVYRVGSGTKATGTEGELKVTAKYAGVAGNKVSVKVVANPNIEGAFNVTTYMDSVAVDVQTVKTVDELVSNKVADFEGTGVLTPTNLVLTTGTDTKAVAGDYADFFDAIQVYEFNTLALPVSDEAIKTTGASFIKRLRDEEGVKAQLVVAKFDGDSEAIINVSNGVILEDGTVIEPEIAVAWVAGASASAGVAGSLTYTTYDNAVDVVPRLTNTQIIDALKMGKFLFTEKRGTAIVEKDINSLHTFTTTRPKDFSKNRIIRVVDDIANSAKETFEEFYIGKVNNDTDGRELFKADRIAYFDSLQAQGAIEAVDPEEIVVGQGEEKDSVVLTVGVTPIDAMEKLYMTVNVK